MQRGCNKQCLKALAQDDEAKVYRTSLLQQKVGTLASEQQTDESLLMNLACAVRVTSLWKFDTVGDSTR